MEKFFIGFMEKKLFFIKSLAWSEIQNEIIIYHFFASTYEVCTNGNFAPKQSTFIFNNIDKLNGTFDPN